MDRRDFLKGTAAFAVAANCPKLAFAEFRFPLQPGAWRKFEISTLIEIASPQGKMQAWVPLPSVNEKDWIKVIDSSWTSNGTSQVARDPHYGAEMLHVQWDAGEKTPTVEVISTISTCDRAVDFSRPDNARIALSAVERKFNTAGTELIPTDGIVKQTSDKIVVGRRTDLDKVRAIYNWVIDNTFRDPKVRGCGVGDVASMLSTGKFGGKCADLNALFVSLVRAAGIPARDVYGIRVAPSKFGYKSLGASSEVITRTQHCRAEVYLDHYGWVAADPADVRKVALEEPPGRLAIDDPKVVAARDMLLGGWEGNWLPYNTAHDVALPGSAGPKLGFLMYPEAECGNSRLDCLDPDTFKYTIRASRA
jgi:transglutaminase-like putative cysteine protease